MNNYALQDVARECGLDDMDFDYYEDSGIGFVPQDANQDPGGQTQGAQFYYTDEIVEDDYDTANINAQMHTSNMQYGVQYPTDDEIEQFYSSDIHDYDLSSPTPIQLHRPTIYNSQARPRLPLTPYNQAEERHHRNDMITAHGAYTQRIATRPTQKDIITNDPHTNRGDNPRNTHGIRLRAVSQLPDIYRGVFKFGVFNAIQSKCYETIMNSRENMVVSAPTGGGKTVLFELALINLLMTSERSSSSKCVYVSPTKALCSERSRDWTAKFEPLGVKCCEMTGDTVQLGRNAWNVAKNATVIITTGEKWDSLTRNWHDHHEFLSEIKLFLVDEVHILNEARGSTLEVVISRMKTRAPNIRFLLVSATVPNIHDIANWIGSQSICPDTPAAVYEFGEEFRPCKLTRHVYGYARRNQNDFQFNRGLDFKLYSILEQHSCGKPILVFCSTRKGVLTTGEQLLKEYEQTIDSRRTPPWSLPKQVQGTFHDKKLEKLAKAGIGVHHAGLSMDDRRTIEDLFLNGSLRIVIATSTLAVGVNLPAHTVIIKGVKIYQNNAWQEYSDLDIMQMIGRAGRPQFDKEGVTIIMCESELEQKYRSLAQGKTVLESSLHQNLSEHINSEVGIKAITNIRGAKEWLRNSFLRHRIEKNPRHYQIGKNAEQTWEEKLDEMVLITIQELHKSQLISIMGEGDSGELSATEYGEIMSKYYIRQSTMASIIQIHDHPSIREILELISHAEELGDVRLRGGDRQVYNKLRDHPDIRFKIKKIEKACDKVFLLIQAVLGGISLSAPEYKTGDSQLALEALSIFRHIPRIARVVVEVAIVKMSGAQLKHGLEVVRWLNAKAYEDRPVVLRQIETVGEKSLKVLAENGVTTLQLLSKQDPTRIELLLNRKAPYGHEILAFVRSLPVYFIAIKELDVSSSAGKRPVSIELSVTCGLEKALNENSKQSKHRSRSVGMTSILTTTSDLDLVDFRRISTKALKEAKSFSITAELWKPSQTINVLITAENFAGLTVVQTYKPNLSASEYPTLETKPKNSIDMDLEGLEDDPNFWDDMMDERHETNVAMTQDTNRDLSMEVIHRTNKSSRTVEKLYSTPSDMPKRLYNGNYACNHSCKDKATCRHLCCREGTTKPPVGLQKHSQEKAKVPWKSTGNSDARIKGSEKTGPKPRTEDGRFQLLTALHEKAGVNNNLGISEGRRLKLEHKTPRTVDLKRKQPLNFDIELADLKTDNYAYAHDDVNDSEEFPEPKNLLTSSRQDISDKTCQAINSGHDHPSETDYSNSEVDAMILSYISDQPTVTSESSKLTHATSSVTNVSIGRKRILSSNAGTDSSLASAIDQPATKKRAYEASRHSDNVPLFLPEDGLFAAETTGNTDDIQHVDDSNMLEEDYFSLDRTLFDIEPTHSDELTAMKTNDASTIEKQETLHNVDRQVIPRGFHTHGQQEIEQENMNSECEDWYDFEEWLQSGAVKIIDD